MTTPLPYQVWIKDSQWRVAPVTLTDCVGRCYPNGVLLIEEGLRGRKRAAVLLHEIIHAILFRSGHHGGDEKLVEAIEDGLTKILWEDPVTRAVLVPGVVQCRCRGRSRRKSPKRRRKMASYGKGKKGKGKSGVCFDKPGSSLDPQKKRSGAGSLSIGKAPNPKKV